MEPRKSVIVDSLLSGFKGVLFDDADMLSYTIRQLVKRYLESHRDAGKKITSGVYLSALGALSTNSIMLDGGLKELEEGLARERKEKAAKKVKKDKPTIDNDKFGAGPY
jgi:hypothetical protein